MTSATTSTTFRLVYLVWNAIMNVTTQDEQVAVFRNAFAHLAPGGRFVVEVIVPQLRRVPAGEVARVFQRDPDHVGIETFDDLVGQIAWSHHWMAVDGRLVHHAAPYRYVWPSELDLMAGSPASRWSTGGRAGPETPSPPRARTRWRCSGGRRRVGAQRGFRHMGVTVGAPWPRSISPVDSNPCRA